MRVILLRDVSKVGKKGEVKDVSDGFARNFLLARGLAKAATESTLCSLEQGQARAAEEKETQASQMRELAEKVKNTTLILSVKVGGKGKTFGSVNSARIQEGLKKLGIQVEKEWIALNVPVKATGEKEIPIELPHGIKTILKVAIQPEKDISTKDP